LGYTHYFYQTKEIPQDRWESLCLDAFQVVDHCADLKIPLVYESDDPNPPLISDDMIRFNGVRNDGHETFILIKKPERYEIYDGVEKHFEFCKTAHKPYDLAVGLVLLLALHHAPEIVSVSSDGRWDSEWVYIREAYRKLFGREAPRFQDDE
jgi:hypothetical protein